MYLYHATLSMRKMRSELAGMGPTPLDPYAVFAGQSTFTLVPTSMLMPTSSQHLMTCPEPILRGRGEFLLQLESKTVPSLRVPSQCILMSWFFLGRVPSLPSANTSIEYFSVRSSVNSDRETAIKRQAMTIFIIQYLQINIFIICLSTYRSHSSIFILFSLHTYQPFKGKIECFLNQIQQLYSCFMGQANNKSQSEIVPPQQTLQQAQKYLLQTDPTLFTLQTVANPIYVITVHLQKERSFEQTQAGFHVNLLLLKLTHQPQFAKLVKRLLEILIKQLKGLISARVLALIPRDKFRRCHHLANFIIFLSDQSMLQNVNLLNIRTDLDEATREGVNGWSKEGSEVPQFVFEDIPAQEMFENVKLLRLGINLMIDLHLKLITRSDFTLTIVDRLNQSCFVLYCKLFFSGRHDISKRERAENGKALVRMGAYFIGLGVERKVASVYELGVLLVEAVLASNAESVLDSKALPSHLFKNIPIINNNEMLNWIAVSILFQLKYVKHEKKLYNRLNANRIPSLRLLQRLIKSLKTPTQQLTFMLQELCLQTKPSQIQRVYVCSLATAYSAFEKVQSEIMRRYSEGKQLTYNVKIMNRQKRVKPEDVRTELQNDEDDIQKQFISLCSKYITHVIFRKNQVLYEYSDKALWNLILYNLDHENIEEQNRGELRQAGELKQVDE